MGAMKRPFPIAQNVVPHLLALAVLLASLHFATTPFGTFVIGATTLIYVSIRGAISFLDYGVSNKANEDMVRATGIIRPLCLDTEMEQSADKEVHDLETRQVKFWIDTGFNCLIALIAILNLLPAIA